MIDVTASKSFHLYGEGILASLFIAMIGCAGLFYISIAPGITSALVEGAGFSDNEAGYVMSANGMGGMMGALMAIFLVGRFPWKRLCYLLMGFAFMVELGTSQITSVDVMIVWRFLAGFFGGCAVAISFAIMGRLLNPDRAFGMLVLLQFGLGGLILTFRPILEGMLGVYAMFFVTATLVAIAIVGITFLPDYRKKAPDDSNGMTRKLAVGFSLLSLALLACVFLFQSSIFGIWTYLERMAVTTGANAETVSIIVGNSAYLGILGALIPIVIGNRYGRRSMIIGGIVAMVVGIALLSQAHVQSLYILSNIILNIAWAGTIAYLLAAVAASEVTGKAAAASSVASKLGISAGPFIAALVLVEGSADFTPVVVAGIVISMLCMMIAWVAVGKLDKRALQQN